MATIHNTTMTPGKLELIAAWLPSRCWYRAVAHDRPRLAKAGGFRLDDPAGEVGVEFLFVADDDRPDAVYHVPLTYRATPLAGAEQALVGTAEHGVLGTRWVYDGTHDPVLVEQLLRLCQGEAAPQHQSRSDTADRSIHVTNAQAWGRGVTRFATVDGDHETVIDALVLGRDGGHPTRVEFRIPRLLGAEDEALPADTAVHADWAAPRDAAGRSSVVRALRRSPGE